MLVLETELGPARIMEAKDGIPDLRGAKVFADIESTSFDDKVEAFNPWGGHRVVGLAITFDDMPGAWYFPIRHRNWDNFDPKVLGLIAGEQWINHNVKFDQHFTWQDGHDFKGEYVCTAVQSKLVDSDRMSHKLKNLCRDLGLRMEDESIVEGILASYKSKDYGRVPADILGRYACMDVMGNRVLYHSLQDRLAVPDELIQTEIDFTRTLVRLERRGILIDEHKCKVELRKSLVQMIQAAEFIESKTGMEVTNSSKFAYNLICGYLGLPVLARTVKKDKSLGGPSFDKNALMLYRGHPKVVTNPGTRALIDALQSYRSEGHWKGLFAESFLEKNVNGVLHPSYNQVVRTGRTSCSDPNSQQMDMRAKTLIKPRYRFYRTDASQIEFRLICHYIKDPDILKAYRENPNTDFHQWVADVCGIDRTPAKTINFAIAYGAGQKKIMEQLISNPKIMSRFECDNPNEYQRRCMEFAQFAIDTYRERLPGIKRLMERASDACRKKGYVKNYYGRRRHLPRKMSFVAGNSMIQGGAMDLIKRRMNELDKLDYPMVLTVHDEVVMDGDGIEREDVQRILSNNDGLRVPMMWDWGESERSWADAK